MNREAPFRAPSPRLDGSGPAVSIDDRVRAVEQRLVARETAWAAHVGLFGQRLRAATRASRVVPTLLGISVALLALWVALRGRPSVVATSTGARAAVADVPWAQWLTLAWPLLPIAWRARVSSATAATLVS